MGEFPNVQLDLSAEMAPGADLTASPSTWAFEELSCEHPSNPAQTISRLLSDPITIRRGVTVGSANNQITSATLNLLNNDGALTPMLASSPYYPYVDAGTPIRLRRRSRTDLVQTFTASPVSNGWPVSDTGEAWTPWQTASQYAGTGTTGTITFPATGVNQLVRSTRGDRDVDITYDVAVNAVALGFAHIAGPDLRCSGSLATTSLALYRLWCAAELNVGGTVTVSVRRYYNSTSSTVLATTVVPALTYSAGTMIRVRVQVIGTAIRMRAWLAPASEPTVWHIDIRQTSNIITGRNAALLAGADDLIGMHTNLVNLNTNPLPVVYTFDNITIAQLSYPLEGYITDVKPVFLPQSDGSTWSTVQVSVGGIGSRLEKQQSPSYSPMRRAVQLAHLPPIAYWPLEDDEGSTYAVSAFPAGPRMVVTGPAVFSFDQGVPTDQYLSRFGTKPMVSLAAGARLVAPVPLSAVTTEWAISFVIECAAPDVPGITEMRLLAWDTPSSSINRWALVATDTGYLVRAYSDSTSTFTDVATFGLVLTGQFTFTVEAHQNGGNIDVEFFSNDNSLDTGSLAGTMAAPTRVSANPDQVNTTASVTPDGLKFVMGHIRVVNEISVLDTPRYALPAAEGGTTVTAIKAWYLEPAHRRLERLCDEERVSFEFLGDPATTGMTILNAQQDGSFTELRDAAAESESGGLLWEAEFGYRYLPRSARYNQDVALSIDLAAYARSGDTDPSDVLVPQLDSRAANYVTVKRTLGGEGSYAADADYRARRGTINEEKTLDLLRDDDTDNHAAWRVHVNVDSQQALYPGVPIDLSANPELIDDWESCDIGSRVQRLNQPTVAGVGTIDQIIAGYAETIAPDRWTVAVDAAPAEVWDTGIWDDPETVYAPGSTTLQSGITATALSMSIGGETWQTGAVDLLLQIGNEHIRVSNISGSGPYTCTISTRSVNAVVASHLSGAAVTLAQPARWAL